MRIIGLSVWCGYTSRLSISFKSHSFEAKYRWTICKGNRIFLWIIFQSKFLLGELLAMHSDIWCTFSFKSSFKFASEYLQLVIFLCERTNGIYRFNSLLNSIDKFLCYCFPNHNVMIIPIRIQIFLIENCLWYFKAIFLVAHAIENYFTELVRTSPVHKWLNFENNFEKMNKIDNSQW